MLPQVFKTMIIQSKPWYKRHRYWTIDLLARMARFKYKWRIRMPLLRYCFVFIGLIAFSNLILSTEPAFMPPACPQTGGIVDLALIYQGGTHRIDWTPEQFKPYLTWTNPDSQKEEWLFDGFLFIEYKSNTGFMFAKGYRAKPSTKEDQLWFLERIFEKGKAVDALDKALGETTQRLGSPSRPRRVVLTLPEPIIQTENWGELNNKALDFKNTEDRIAAVKWFINLLLERWNKEAYQNIELAGFYWVAEEMGESDTELMRAIGQYIRSLNKQFYWIPWWRSPGSKVWKDLGFDVAYQQPNYFFKLEVPDGRVEEACRFAKEHGMGLEMEWDGRVMSDTTNFARRLQGYLEGFEQAGVWKEAAVAHYMGGHELIALSKSREPEVVALYRRLCSTIAERQKRKDCE